MNAPPALILDLLAWIAATPRTYREVMEAWGTRCPQLPVWEDAVDLGLIQRDRFPDGRPFVTLSAAGQAVFEGAEMTL